MCKDLGADEVIDYSSTDVSTHLSSGSQPFDFILDNVGTPTLYWTSPSFTKPGAKYVQVGSEVSLPFVYDIAYRFLVPTWLGGGQRPFAFGLASTNFGDYTALGNLIVAGKVKPVINEVLGFEHAPKAYEMLRTGRAKGKIVIRVQSNER
jgi:NADPH:quinone reductase-like Zn-dependent oxidoreductase